MFLPFMRARIMTLEASGNLDYNSDHDHDLNHKILNDHDHQSCNNLQIAISQKVICSGVRKQLHLL